MRLIDEYRDFWYGGEEKFHGWTRQRLELYGGPSPGLSECQKCQEAEWKSRIHQENRSPRRHKCKLLNECRAWCAKQGDEDWTHWHQDHWFAVTKRRPGTPHIGVFLSDDRSLWMRYWSRICDQWAINLRRALARCGTVEVLRKVDGTDWDSFDVIFLQNRGGQSPLIETSKPVVLYHHDPCRWLEMQQVIDHYQPAVFFSSNPLVYAEYLEIPSSTVMIPAKLTALGTFFSRPNLNPDQKACDLMSVGALEGAIYTPRLRLETQIKKLPSRWDVQRRHDPGLHRIHNAGPVDRFLNGWSRLLGSSRYVIFGDNEIGITVPKCSEVLGCGAIPIMPQTPDLETWGIEPWVHYIPLSHIIGRNDRLEELLAHYDDNRHIAEAAVAWHQENIDGLIFGNFERAISTALERTI